MPRSEQPYHAAWPGWILAVWVVGVMIVYAERMAAARPAALAAIRRIVGLE
jgi:hypothetical protein